MLASKGSDTKRWSQLNAVGKGMFYGDGLFLSSDNEKLQPHKALPAGPQGAVRSVLAMHVRRYVCVCTPIGSGCLHRKRIPRHLPSFFKAAAEDGE